jgi:DNA polymerase-3 subunit epsilon
VATPAQLSLDDVGTSLRDVTFVVVDLETTGGSREADAVTEIGAVKVRAGEVLGELATLVDPGRAVPAQIQVLTGITDAMLVAAPPMREVLPTFLEWAHGCVLVAHNAPFDVGFLRAACQKQGLVWPHPPVVDTVRLARTVLGREEVANHRLATLATFFGSPDVPVHRALADARATVHVLHGLLGRLGPVGVRTLEELLTHSAGVPDTVRRKRHLADGLPTGPGVYVFRDDRSRALYVGTSQEVRSRVRTYFTAAERRQRMRDMVSLAQRVDVLPCATPLEAAVRELRLIAAEKPRFNRQSRQPGRAVWLGLTQEAFPRLTLVRAPAREGPWIGPFPSRDSAELARAAVQEGIPLRTCTRRVGPRTRSSPCPLYDLGRCGAPCAGLESQESYARHVELAVEVLSRDPAVAVSAVEQRMHRLSQQQGFEEACLQRDRARALITGASRAQQAHALVRAGELVAARARPGGGWELHCIRHGRLAGATVLAPGASAAAAVDALVATAESVVALPGPGRTALAAETALLLRWLGGDGTHPPARLVRCEQPWSSWHRGATRLRSSWS